VILDLRLGFETVPCNFSSVIRNRGWVIIFHVALHASHAALPMVTPKLSP
jgi:hypothetical protein